MKKVCTRFLLGSMIALITGCAASKSANPLTPTVAGPIPGVGITAPTLIEPNGSRVSVESQPVTLVVGNSSSSGPRPVTYVFDVATDAGFQSVVFTRTGIPPGDGKTSLRLPDQLASQRTYYWRAKADDGANQSDYSGTAHFDVFTPIVIDKPQLLEPANNVKVSSVRPTFSFANAARTGPAGPITYTIEVSQTDSFATKAAAWTVNEQPNQTSSQAPQDGPYATYFFWRVRASDPTTVGPWSDVRALLTPDPPPSAPPPAPGGPPPTPGNWQACGSTPGVNLVACVHAAVNPAHTPEGAFEVTKRVAWLIRGTGAGLLIKNGGENIVAWKGYSFAAARICYPDGHIYKILSDVPATNGPSWQDNDFVDRSLYVPAINPE